MSFELTGKIIEIGEEKKFSDKFRKREFVIEKVTQTNTSEFSDYIKFQLVNNNCENISGFNAGDEVTVYFNVKGNKWEKDGKTSYFTNLDAWKITSVSESKQSVFEDPGPGPENEPPEPDDLPF